MSKVKDIDFSKYGFVFVEKQAFMRNRVWILYSDRKLVDAYITDKNEFKVVHFNQKIFELIIELVKKGILDYE